MAVSVGSTGALLGLRALAAAQASMRVRLVTAVPTFILPVAFGGLYGAVGFAAGLTIAMFASTVLLWRSYMATLPSAEWSSYPRFSPDERVPPGSSCGTQ